VSWNVDVPASLPTRETRPTPQFGCSSQPGSHRLMFGPGVAGHSPGYLTLAAVTLLALGFGQEATFRGVVPQILLPRGRMRAVLLSSVLYSVANIGNLP
jgi:hypothetical protein